MLSLAAVLLACGAGTCAAQALQMEINEPRAHGWRLGDTPVREVVLEVPAGLALDVASLPEPGRVNGALELRARSSERRSLDGGTRLVLRLEYQLFASPPEVRIVELPALRLRFTGLREEQLRIDAWPLAVAPLAPDPPVNRRGFGELLPDTAPPPLGTEFERGTLWAAAGAGVLLLGYLAFVYVGLPWWVAGRRPFGRAYRTLRADARGPEGWQDAYRSLHSAFDETAGRVLFAESIDAFLARAPRFAALRDDIHSFYARSRAGFFGVEGARPGDAAEQRWLLDFARACRDAERGAA